MEGVNRVSRNSRIKQSIRAGKSEPTLHNHAHAPQIPDKAYEPNWGQLKRRTEPTDASFADRSPSSSEQKGRKEEHRGKRGSSYPFVRPSVSSREARKEGAADRVERDAPVEVVEDLLHVPAVAAHVTRRRRRQGHRRQRGGVPVRRGAVLPHVARRGARVPPPPVPEVSERVRRGASEVVGDGMD
jgi:hypothetical protein